MLRYEKCCLTSLRSGTSIIGLLCQIKDTLTLLSIIKAESYSILKSTDDTYTSFEVAILSLVVIAYISSIVCNSLLLYGIFISSHMLLKPWLYFNLTLLAVSWLQKLYRKYIFFVSDCNHCDFAPNYTCGDPHLAHDLVPLLCPFCSLLPDLEILHLGHCQLDVSVSQRDQTSDAHPRRFGMKPHMELRWDVLKEIDQNSCLLFLLNLRLTQIGIARV